ncbi:MAG: T9SS type A sorting domain-containing protein [Bacteroidia bacterium]|nr:T9SS type A sorting domain-containing protein [Bacteroidia bacterium]
MKNIIIAAFLLIAASSLVSAQINPEASYNYSGIYTYLPSVGNKFYIMDVSLSQCRIYNADHSLWKTINLSVPANNWLYDIKFVSEGLFTTDNGLCLAYIYYSYNDVGQYYTYTAKVVRENGTQLLSIPGCQYLIVQKLANGSSKLLAYVYDYSVFPVSVQTKVYSLPGSLVTNQFPNTAEIPLQQAFPNPAGHSLTLPWVLPENISKANLHIQDAAGRSLRTMELNNSSGQLQIDVSGWPGGQYLYYIESGKFRTAGGKFTVAKP